MHVEAYRIGKALSKVKSTIENISSYRSHPRITPEKVNQDLNFQCFELRRTLEDAEDNISGIITYLSHKSDPAWPQEPSYISMNADLKRLIEEARRVEAEARDYMQLQAGKLALEESRRSIELSNVQIRESKRGRFVKEFSSYHAKVLQ